MEFVSSFMRSCRRRSARTTANKSFQTVASYSLAKISLVILVMYQKVKQYEEYLAQTGGEQPFLSIVAPFEMRSAWYKAIVLIGAALYACCVALPPDDKPLAKLILATVFSILFAVGSIVTQPYRDVVEDRTDMACRAFLILTLVVGIILETEPGPGGRALCDGILGMIVLASDGMFIYVLNPLRLLRGIRKAMRDSRNAANSAGWRNFWNGQATNDLDAEELKAIKRSIFQRSAGLKYSGS